ncbi:hypothetical protein N7493_001865 [Penicillium malachiteum]|uniref:Zn(2)-C6 fungal-type domain-containing protein n=1 Tax=Penicillium malachiteum TaxID=1324776 RepID=A0AAD6HW11_9EURO|nr:hypothetical protein N7493_001865 [Penicillium malachiteum]
MESRNAMTEPSNKRPRSPTGDHPPQSKIPKTHSNHLQINYLARQYPDNLPLVAADDTMPAIIHLLGEYDGVLHRHESIAGNLGACPLGPILIKRFERLFDGPPKVLKSHGKDGPTVTWLDVVEFAKNKPEQFNLEKSRNGVRVCQFYTKQCRVEISEEDFVLIASGMPQKMIPPQPISEDEEKELGALEILEKNLQQIIQMADQVSARARQLSYRLKNRRTAIVSRRENDATLKSRSTREPWRDISRQAVPPHNGHSSQVSPLGGGGGGGFVAVNAANAARPDAEVAEDHPQFAFSHSNTDNITIINGTSIKGASPTTRAELMKKFFTTADRQARGYEDPTPAATTNPPLPHPRPQSLEVPEYTPTANSYNTASTPVAIPNTPSSLLPPPKSNTQEKDDGGPFKLEMVARMDELQRGERVVPPCDRCRRLHMDCVKNLTACMGCTKKHAKCSWRDVKEDELRAVWASSSSQTRERLDKEHAASFQQRTSPAARTSAERHEPFDPVYAHHTRRESAPSAPQVTPKSAAPVNLPSQHNSPRRAVSETEGATAQPGPAQNTDDDPDANQRLMQAILDTVDHHKRVAAAVQEKERGVERGPERGDVPHDRDADREKDRDHDRDRRLVPS